MADNIPGDGRFWKRPHEGERADGCNESERPYERAGERATGATEEEHVYARPVARVPSIRHAMPCHAIASIHGKSDMEPSMSADCRGETAMVRL